MKNMLEVNTIGNLLDIIKENDAVVVRLNGKNITLTTQYYIEDECWYGFANETFRASDKKQLKENVLHECWDECWRDDIYQAPYDRVSNCELRICVGDDIDEDESYEVADVEYEEGKTILVLG